MGPRYRKNLAQDLLRIGGMETQTRKEALCVEQLDDLRVLTRHHEFVRGLTDDETHEAVGAVRSAPPNTITAADGNFDSVGH